MRRLDQAIGGGEPVDRSARFALTAFLHGAGLAAEQIMQRFAGRGDFDAGETAYQVRHVTGANGRPAYQAPGCAKMQALGLCPLKERDGLCHAIRHPSAYYRIKTQSREAAA
jgi:DNA primase large subunit